MTLEDHGEVLDYVDVMTLFGYRCLACGHVESATHGFPQVDNHMLASEPEIQHIG